VAETSRRPFTAQERWQLQASLHREVARTAGLFDAFVAFGGSLLLFLVVLGLFRGYSRQLELVASGVSLLIGAYVYVRAQRSPSRAEQSARVRQELEQGEAEVLRYQVLDAIAVEELEDEGLGFYLKLADGRVLFLAGQYLHEPVEERRFPNTFIELVRAPTTHELLDFRVLGVNLQASARRPPFSAEEYRRGSVPEDGSVLDVDFESLRLGHDCRTDAERHDWGAHYGQR